MLRSAAARLCLALFLILTWRLYRVREFWTRVRDFPQEASLPAWDASARGAWFWFDRPYAAFLESVREATPPNSTIALDIVQPNPAGEYRGTAAYYLAPRRVVGMDRLGEADTVAVYGEKSIPPARRVARVVHGTVAFLR